MFGRATIMLGIGPHSSYYYFTHGLVSESITNNKQIYRTVGRGSKGWVFFSAN